MAKPDYILYGALVVSEHLSFAEAQALCDAHGTASYDRPVPANLDAGIEIAIDALSEADDDEAIDAMLNHRDGDDVCVDNGNCEICGEPIEGDDDGVLSDEEVDHALGLYFAVRSIVAANA